MTGTNVHASGESRFRAFIDVTKDSATLLREIVIILLIVGLVFWTDYFREVAQKLGLKGVDVAGIALSLDESQTATKTAAGDVSNLQQQVNQLASRLQSLQDAAKGTKLSSEVDSFVSLVTNLSDRTNAADQSLSSSLVKQQQVLNEASPASSAAATIGWIFLGQVDESKTAWGGEGARTISPSVDPAAIQKGTVITLENSTFLYGDAKSGHHFEGPVLSALPRGAQVSVLDNPDYSHAIRGGYFVWVKVSRVS
jgi:hypothetical protein